MRAAETIVNTTGIQDPTYPTFGHFPGRRKLEF